MRIRLSGPSGTFELTTAVLGSTHKPRIHYSGREYSLAGIQDGHVHYVETPADSPIHWRAVAPDSAPGA